MSWLRFAPKGMTNAQMRLCFGKGGLADHGIPFMTEYLLCGFRVDTYIPPRLVVENDGASHLRETRLRKDNWKDSVLEEHGFKVLRFTDTQIKKQLDEVVKQILASVV